MRRSAFLIGLPNGVMNRGVLIIGVRKFGVLALLLGVLAAGSTRSPPAKESSGDRDREGEWNCDGGAEMMGGVISLGVIGADTGGVMVRGVIGAETGGVDSRGVIGRGVIGVELTSL